MAKPALKSAQKRTPSPKNGMGLSPRQETALRVLLGGGSVTQAAEEAGVRREQVSRWRHHDEAFKDAMREAQGDLRRAVRQRLESAAGDAVGVLHDLLDDPSARNRLLAAKAILGFVNDLTSSASADVAPPGTLPSWKEALRHADESERARLEELGSVGSQDRELMRQLIERFRSRVRDVQETQEKLAGLTTGS